MKKVLFILHVFIQAGIVALHAQNLPHFTGGTDSTALGIYTNYGQIGCAWGDYDNDGYLDVFVSGGGSPSQLFHNNGHPDGDGKWFTNVTKKTRTDTDPTHILYETGDWTAGALWADLDNDGYLDLVVTNGAGIAYFKNDGPPTFNFTLKKQLTTGGLGTKWGITCADLDGDGYVDLAIGSGGSGPSANAGPLTILHNDFTVGDTIAFSDVTAQYVDGTVSFIESWNPFFVDYNNDGWMDLFMPCFREKPQMSILLHNTGGGLLEITDQEEVGLVGDFAINSTWGDYNNDSYMDLFVIPYIGTNCDSINGKPCPPAFYRNNGDGTFAEITKTLGCNLDTSTDMWGGSRGASFGDFDNDGWMDLLVGNRISGNQMMLHNNGGTGFTRVYGIGLDEGTHGDSIPQREKRVAAFIDYNNDGFLDIFLAGNIVYKYLLTNQGNSNHWLGIIPQVTVAQCASGINKAGIGARVQVYVGGLMMTRVINTGADAGESCIGLRANFGLGSATAADSVVITWPNGSRTSATNVLADNYYKAGEVIVNATGVAKSENLPRKYELSQNFPNPFNPTTTIEFTLPVKSNVQLVLINMLGQEVKVITNGTYEAGSHQVTLNASRLASGVYFYKLHTPGFSAVKKLVLLK